MKSAQIGDDFMTGPEIEVVGVRQNDLGSQLFQFKRR
jgi:hypothetical protein